MRFTASKSTILSSRKGEMLADLQIQCCQLPSTAAGQRAPRLLGSWEARKWEVRTLKTLQTPYESSYRSIMRSILALSALEQRLVNEGQNC